MSHACGILLCALQVQVLLSLCRPATHHFQQMQCLGSWLRSPRVMRPPGNWSISLLDEQIHTAILGSTHHKITAEFAAQRQEGKDITAPISHVDPLHPCWRRAQRRDTTFPDLRFPLTLLSLTLGFSLRRWLTQEGFLLRNPEHLATLGQHRQHRLQQKALMAPGTDGTQARRCGMRVIVHVRRVLDQQHLCLLTSRFSRLLQVWADQLLIADTGVLQEAIGSMQSPLIGHLPGQGGTGLTGDAGCDLDGSSGASLIPQMHGTKGVLSPRLGRQQDAGIHLLPSFLYLDSS